MRRARRRLAPPSPGTGSPRPDTSARRPAARRSLAFRVAAATSLATLATMLAFALLLHHQMQSAIEGWERRQAAALAHHLATMLDALPPEERAAGLEQLNAPLA